MSSTPYFRSFVTITRFIFFVKAGVLLDGIGQQPNRKEWQIGYNGDKRTLINGRKQRRWR